MKRREFLKAGISSFGASALPTGLLAAMGGKESEIAIPYSDVVPYTQMKGTTWYKGDTHIHTMLSDGGEFSDVVAALYKRAGYHFAILTDHDVTPAGEEFWIQASDFMRQWRKVTPEHLARIKANFPALMPKTRKEADGRLSYRVKPFPEVERLVNEPGRFLVIPGNEVTCYPENGDDLHCNLLNVRDVPCRGYGNNRPDVEKQLDWCVEARNRVIGKVNAEAVFTVNHPLWTSFDVKPQWLIDHPSIRFFEVYNSGSTPRFNLPAGKGTCTHDRFWDVINAARAKEGMPLIYGVGCDDRHNMEPIYEGRNDRPAYTTVASPELSIPEIMHALYRGNFYASSGLDLKGISFDRDSKTLTVEVDPQPGFEYTILFIGTKKGVDTTIQGWTEYRLAGRMDPSSLKRGFKIDRKVPYYSEEIGKVLQESKGVKASYSMRPDDLYVRAKIITQKGVLPENRVQVNPIAWTQPVAG
ncbi:MAG: hypothetical protein PHV28_04735 [Kiritimatiellae bacterium]|nr:hypothetical protein [Kiritimatiellia bacterium]